ncbi:protease Do-like 1, chloroplastic [Primulina huaijiensis]|uniref:protease Do-like 1, chloroplastic n=1 Tax=Primulina huaijiensis TaxID=1492673 RepID=UPI003CC711EF
MLCFRQDASTLDVLDRVQDLYGISWATLSQVIMCFRSQVPSIFVFCITGATFSLNPVIISVLVGFRVTRADQTSYDAKVIGFDQDKDVTVLRIHAPKAELRPIPIGLSADLLVGQKIYAIGNPVPIEVLLRGDHLEKVPVVLEPKRDES